MFYLNEGKPENCICFDRKEKQVIYLQQQPCLFWSKFHIDKKKKSESKQCFHSKNKKDHDWKINPIFFFIVFHVFILFFSFSYFISKQPPVKMINNQIKYYLYIFIYIYG